MTKYQFNNFAYEIDTEIIILEDFQTFLDIYNALEQRKGYEQELDKEYEALFHSKNFYVKENGKMLKGSDGKFIATTEHEEFLRKKKLFESSPLESQKFPGITVQKAQEKLELISNPKVQELVLETLPQYCIKFGFLFEGGIKDIKITFSPEITSSQDFEVLVDLYNTWRERQKSEKYLKERYDNIHKENKFYVKKDGEMIKGHDGSFIKTIEYQNFLDEQHALQNTYLTSKKFGPLSLEQLLDKLVEITNPTLLEILHNDLLSNAFFYLEYGTNLSPYQEDLSSSIAQLTLEGGDIPHSTDDTNLEISTIGCSSSFDTGNHDYC